MTDKQTDGRTPHLTAVPQNDNYYLRPFSCSGATAAPTQAHHLEWTAPFHRRRLRDASERHPPTEDALGTPGDATFHRRRLRDAVGRHLPTRNALGTPVDATLPPETP